MAGVAYCCNKIIIPSADSLHIYHRGCAVKLDLHSAASMVEK